MTSPEQQPRRTSPSQALRLLSPWPGAHGQDGKSMDVTPREGQEDVEHHNNPRQASAESARRA